jgi:hypothetical protein
MRRGYVSCGPVSIIMYGKAVDQGGGLEFGPSSVPVKKTGSQ